MQRGKIIFGLISILGVILLISSTIGRELLQGQPPSLLSFIILHFTGYIFFFMMPVESLVPFYVSEGHHLLLLFGITIVTALAAQNVNYFIGKLMSAEIITNLIGKKKYDKVDYYIEKYGSIAIIIFNIIPSASAILSLFAGMIRFTYKKFTIYTLIGVSIKYSLLIYISHLLL